MRSIKFLITISITAFGVYLFLSSILFELWSMRKGNALISSVKLSYVIVHIDLKGAPPKLEYLKFLLPMLRDNGVNGLLMEYEDMFPYEGKLVNLSARNCYNKAKLKDFLIEAVKLGLEIVPLIQTFGHLEFALKLEQFSHLREVPEYPDSICPSNVGSRVLVKQMLEQVVNFHNSISPLKHIHVGCDEVFQINKCDLCLSRKLSDVAIFMDHVRYVADTMARLSPETTILIWDDMLRKIKPYQWTNVGPVNNIEPVYWDYAKTFDVSHVSLMYYHRRFNNIWTASAFKGADGMTSTIPNLKSRLLNHLSWMNLLLNFKIPGENKIFAFKGIILTGWSRYSHSKPICELLPVAIPSLILNLRMIKKFKSNTTIDDNINTDISDFYSKYLSRGDINFICETRLQEYFDPTSCSFEGKELYNILRQFIEIKKSISFYLHHNITTLFPDNNPTKIMNMQTLLEQNNWYRITLNEIKEMESKLSKIMKKYYDDDVIFQYISSKTYNVKEEIFKLLDI